MIARRAELNAAEIAAGLDPYMTISREISALKAETDTRATNKANVFFIGCMLLNPRYFGN